MSESENKVDWSIVEPNGTQLICGRCATWQSEGRVTKHRSILEGLPTYARRPNNLSHFLIDAVYIIDLEHIILSQNLFETVASLTMVSPGAVTDGVTLYFFLEKVTTYLVIVLKSDKPF